MDTNGNDTNERALSNSQKLGIGLLLAILVTVFCWSIFMEATLDYEISPKEEEQYHLTIMVVSGLLAFMGTCFSILAVIGLVIETARKGIRETRVTADPQETQEPNAPPAQEQLAESQEGQEQQEPDQPEQPGESQE